jgi:hypothetical protein
MARLSDSNEALVRHLNELLVRIDDERHDRLNEIAELLKRQNNDTTELAVRILELRDAKGS